MKSESRYRPTQQILQIMPAPGWVALYMEEGGAITESAIAFFALVSEVRGSIEERYVEAFDADSSGEFDSIASPAPNFVGLKSPATTAEQVNQMKEDFFKNGGGSHTRTYLTEDQLKNLKRDGNGNLILDDAQTKSWN